MTPRTTRLMSWNGPLPEAGDLMETRAGTTYLVLKVTATRPGSKSVAVIDLGKLTSAEADKLPPGRPVHVFEWLPRSARGGTGVSA